MKKITAGIARRIVRYCLLPTAFARNFGTA